MRVGELELVLSHSGWKLFLAADRRRAHRAVTASEEGNGAVWFFFFCPFFLLFSRSTFCVEEQTNLHG